MNKSVVYTITAIIIIAVAAAILFIPDKAKDFTVNNPDDCNKIKNVEERDNCLFNIAVNLGNEEACNFLSENKDKCLELVAAGFDKFYLCGQIEDKGSKANCFLAQNQGKGFEACEALTDSIEGDEGQKSLVIDSCYINIFLNQNMRIEDCNSIKDVNLKAYCQAVINKNPGVCSSVEDNILFNKVVCTTEVARKLNDNKICETLSVQDDIQQCKNNLEAAL
ncbi:hypothetical protein J4414_01475 [Candidatus Woesearchaeota archaeon]|nr:hypothetical protein [Candidatus Woesearchaeota archaeon]